MASGEARRLFGYELGKGFLIDGTYVVESLRSRGGFAHVYRARHASTSQPVAIKVLLRDHIFSSQALLRFQREASAIDRISHPGIVRVLGSGTLVDGRPYIVMEWLEGRDLAEHLRLHGPYSKEEALGFMKALTAPVMAAHRAGIVHRDLKAQNVMIVPRADGGDEVKLVDFGIAKFLEPDGDGTALTTHNTPGTPLAMAPEQILRQAIDQRTDIYALGLLLFQLLTGELPFHAATAIELEELHLSAAPPRASDRAPLPRAIDEVIFRALAKDKEERFPDVDSLLQALGHAVLAAERQGAEAKGVALHLAVRAGEDGRDEDDDEDDDNADAILALGREACIEGGLLVVHESGRELLAVATDRGAAQGDLRERLLLLAAALGDRIAARPGAQPSVKATIALHSGAVILASDGNTPRAGELLQVTWAPSEPGLFATPDMLEGATPGLAERFIQSRDGGAACKGTRG